MNHQEFLQSLSAEQKSQLTARSNAAGLRQLGIHLLLIASNSWLLTMLPGLISSIVLPGSFVGGLSGVAVWLLLSVSQGILLVFLFTLLHETTHHTPFQNIRLNRVVGWACGMVIFLPAGWFRHFHLAHHRHTHVPDKDPELASPKPASVLEYVWYLTGIPVWKSHVQTLIRNAMGRCNDDFVPSSRNGFVVREARVMLGVYLGLFTLTLAFSSASLLLTLWLVPIVLGQPFLRAYLLAEHAHCEHSSDMFTNTRTTLTGRVVYRLAWNMPYHAEHHAFPSVPFFRLPQLHQLTAKHLRVKQNGYWRFNRHYWQQE